MSGPVGVGGVALGVGSAAAAANWALPVALKRRSRAAFLARVERSGAVHLTFDDGPHPDGTPQILDLLGRAGARASFFFVGRRAVAHPDIVGRARDEGHLVGSHGYDHTHAWKRAPWHTARDLGRGAAVLDAIVPGSRGVLRPPYGKLNLGSLRFLSANTAWWNVDPEDYACSSGAEVMARLDDRLRPGSVVLLHDGRAAGAPPRPTVEAVALILERGKSLGLRFEPLPVVRTGPSRPHCGSRRPC